MANRKDKLQGGISAIFGEGQVPVPISDDEYAEMERRQSERRFFLTGRRRNGDDRELVTRNEIF